MQVHLAEQFDREFAGSEREWLARLPSAVGAAPSEQVGRALTARIGEGELALSWREAPPRAGQSGPRLLVSFRFRGLQDIERWRFMRGFERVMQPERR